MAKLESFATFKNMEKEINRLKNENKKLLEALKTLDNELDFEGTIHLLEGTTHSEDMINALQKGLNAIQNRRIKGE